MKIPRTTIFLIIAIMLAVSGCSLAAPDFNPKAADRMDVSLVRSGVLESTGTVYSAQLILYIPQENVKSISITPNNYEYVYDEFGNKLLKIKWDRVRNSEPYRVEILIENKAKYLDKIYPIRDSDSFLNETDKIIFTDDVKLNSYPFSKDLPSVFELAKWTNDFIKYDSSYVGSDLNTQEIENGRKGVCTEYATYLTVLLRYLGIPTRYVAGYSWSPVENSFVGHTWIEVLTNKNGQDNWVSFDPTWLEGGYLDATHIKTANLLDSEQRETVTYYGDGRVAWMPDQDTFTILNVVNKSADLQAWTEDAFPSNGYGYIRADVKMSGCGFSDITALSCLDANRSSLLKITEPRRVDWFCDSSLVYWIFPMNGRNYICPVVVYDQTGASTTLKIRANNATVLSNLAISGPDTARINSEYTISTNLNVDMTSSIFFSSGFGRFYQPIINEISKIPGKINYYLWRGGSAAVKEINITKEKLFLLDASVSESSVAVGDSFTARVNVTNIQYWDNKASLTLSYDDQIFQREITILPGDSAVVSYRFTSKQLGEKKVFVTVEDNPPIKTAIPVFSYDTDRYKQLSYGTSDFLSMLWDIFLHAFGLGAKQAAGS